MSLPSISRKPDEPHHRIEQYVRAKGPFLELFARQSGWPGAWKRQNSIRLQQSPPLDGPATPEQGFRFFRNDIGVTVLDS